MAGYAPKGPADWSWHVQSVSDTYKPFPCATSDCPEVVKQRLSIYRGGLIYSIVLFCRKHSLPEDTDLAGMKIEMVVGQGLTAIETP